AGESRELVAQVRLVGEAEVGSNGGPVGAGEGGGLEVVVDRRGGGGGLQQVLEAGDAGILLGRDADPAAEKREDMAAGEAGLFDNVGDTRAGPMKPARDVGDGGMDRVSGEPLVEPDLSGSDACGTALRLEYALAERIGSGADDRIEG